MAAAEFTTRDAAFLAATLTPPPPPAGVTPNFDKRNINGLILIVISLVMMLLAMTFTIIRIYTKAILTRALGWDDCTFANIAFESEANLQQTRACLLW